MAKATDSQVKQVKEAMAAGKVPDVAVRINFGDQEPIQKAETETKASDSKSDGK